ncbi:MAG: hypothetical protein Q8M20_03160 [Rhodocyclaceae bacterium]|nr:hypothetical protein [Rhodocyclaceae bacterium]MDZ4213380.1 hypothetical protein [Rhodocyclaceae bacterium]
MPRQLHALWLVLTGLASFNVSASGYYLCQDPKTGKKTAQDSPCQQAKQIGNYPQVSDEELKAREVQSRKSRREFEQKHPGTYRPEEYMTDEELAEYQSKAIEREAERKKREDEKTLQDASRRAVEAELRAKEAERVAHEASARAAAAEQAAQEAAAQARQPLILMPSPNYPRPVMSPPYLPRKRSSCDDGKCNADGTRKTELSKDKRLGEAQKRCKPGGVEACL